MSRNGHNISIKLFQNTRRRSFNSECLATITAKKIKQAMNHLSPGCDQTILTCHIYCENIVTNFQAVKGRCQKLLSGFFPSRGGVPPLSAKLFWAQCLSVKGGGVPPNSVKEKNGSKRAKIGVFWPKTAVF